MAHSGAAPQCQINPTLPECASVWASITSSVMGGILRSAYLSSWETLPAFTSTRLNAIAFADNAFLAVGQDGVMFTSTDGANWRAISYGHRPDLYGVAYGNGQYVAVGTNGAVLTSADARIWQSRPSGTSDALRSVTFGDG